MSKDNKTDQWKTAPPSTLYQLPIRCPECYADLITIKMHLGTFPYQYADLQLECVNCREIYNFCYPQHPIMAEGQHIFDTQDTWYWIEEQIDDKDKDLDMYCPFHHNRLEIQRYYGNLTYKDDTRKVQLKCPKCNYYKRIQI